MRKKFFPDEPAKGNEGGISGGTGVIDNRLTPGMWNTHLDKYPIRGKVFARIEGPWIVLTLRAREPAVEFQCGATARCSGRLAVRRHGNLACRGNPRGSVPH